MRKDITKLTLGVDRLLPSIDNPLHRAILLNYRRHAMLEISGRHEEIFVPEMTIAEPVYRFYNLDPATPFFELSGRESVQGIYKDLVDRRITVMMLEHETISVADWGFASEALFHYYTPGHELGESDRPEDFDVEATYLVSRWHAMVWPYDRRGRMKGEHVYMGIPESVRRLADEEIWQVEEVRAALDPLLNDPAPLGEDHPTDQRLQYA